MTDPGKQLIEAYEHNYSIAAVATTDWGAMEGGYIHVYQSACQQETLDTLDAMGFEVEVRTDGKRQVLKIRKK